VAEGALPFSCQGNENGLVIEGGATIGYEIVEQMAAWPPARLKPCPTDINPGSLLPDPDWQGANEAGPNTHLASLDRVFVQVGGGALASACIRALTESVRSGSLAAMPRRSTPTRLPRWGPRICAVQTGGGYPLKRAYDRFVEHVLERLESASHSSRRAFASDAERAAWLLETVPDGLLEDSLRYARAHRSVFMWPWETEPRSIAAGILDDETYDWAAVVEGMVRSSGFPIVVDEATLREANARAREATGIDVDHTGSSGLAGLFALTRTDGRPRPDERVVVLFTGVRREGADV
jgi:threonine synthase